MKLKMQANIITYPFLMAIFLVIMTMHSNAAPVGKVQGRNFPSSQTPTPGQDDTCFTLC